MGAERDELARLAEEIPDKEVSSVLAEVRKQLRRVGRARWPPAWFGIATGDGEAVVARSEESSRTASASGKARHEVFRRGATATRRGIHPTRTQGSMVRLWPVT